MNSIMGGILGLRSNTWREKKKKYLLEDLILIFASEVIPLALYSLSGKISYNIT